MPFALVLQIIVGCDCKVFITSNPLPADQLLHNHLLSPIRSILPRTILGNTESRVAVDSEYEASPKKGIGLVTSDIWNFCITNEA